MTFPYLAGAACLIGVAIGVSADNAALMIVAFFGLLLALFCADHAEQRFHARASDSINHYGSFRVGYEDREDKAA